MNSLKYLTTTLIIIFSVLLISSCGSKSQKEEATNSATQGVDSTIGSTEQNVSSNSSTQSVYEEVLLEEENSEPLTTTDQASVSSTEDVEYEPVEMNSLQTLFSSITSSSTRDEVDEYIEENGLVKYAFTGDSAYYIGYETSAIRSRGRDREGEAVDLSFATSGDPNLLGTVIHAEYAVHTGSSTHYSLEYKNGVFYYTDTNFEKFECIDGYDAMQRYLTNNYKYATPIKKD